MVQAAMLFARFAVIQLLISLCVVVTVGGFSSGPPSIVDARKAPAGTLRNITYGELVCTHLAPGHFTDLSQPQAGNGGYIVNATELIDVLGGSYAPGKRYRGQSCIFSLLERIQMHVLHAEMVHVTGKISVLLFLSIRDIIAIAEKKTTQRLYDPYS